MNLSLIPRLLVNINTIIVFVASINKTTASITNTPKHSATITHTTTTTTTTSTTIEERSFIGVPLILLLLLLLVSVAQFCDASGYLYSRNIFHSSACVCATTTIVTTIATTTITTTPLTMYDILLLLLLLILLFSYYYYYYYYSYRNPHQDMQTVQQTFLDAALVLDMRANWVPAPAGSPPVPRSANLRGLVLHTQFRCKRKLICIHRIQIQRYTNISS